MKKRTRFISMILSFLMILSSFSFAFGAPSTPEQTPNVGRLENLSLKDLKMSEAETVKALDMNEKVRVIIELKDKSVLDYPQAQELGAKSFLETEAAGRLRDDIVSTQELVQTKILDTVNSNIEFKYAYTNALNGFAAEVQRKDIAKIREMPEVKKVYRDTAYELPEPQMKTGTGMVNAPKAWETGYDGEGTVVAVLDTGVDVNHELMILSNATTPKFDKAQIAQILPYLNAAKRYAGISVNDVYKNEKFPFCFDYPDKDPDAFADNSNHGVHVSGTVAANGDAAKAKGITLHTEHPFNGVAPEAQVFGMKIFSSTSPYAYTSDTLAAIDDSILLGADAINMSIGSVAGFTNDADGAEFSYENSLENARKAGIVIAVSAGNSNRVGNGSLIGNANRPYPTTANVDSGLLGSPSAKYYSTSVASMDNTNILLAFDPLVYVTDEGVRKAPMAAAGNIIPYKVLVGQQEFVDGGSGHPTELTNVAGKIALVVRGGLTPNFVDKIANAQDAGAIGIIVRNHEAGGEGLINMATPDVHNIPAVFIGYTDGLALMGLADKKVEFSGEQMTTEEPSATAWLMSDFTSWGTTPDLKLKPEITAPGGDIYSTIVGNRYASMSGTSMASPHVAGGIAVMQQYVNDDPRDLFGNINYSMNRANLIEALLMSTAKTVYDDYDEVYSPRRQGAGLMDLEAAINSDVYLMNEDSGKAKIELYDKIGDSFDIEFDIINLSDTPYDYKLSGTIFSEYSQALTGLPGGQSLYFMPSYSLYLEDAEILVEESSDINFSEATTASAIRINPAGEHVTSGTAIDAIVTAKPGTTHVKLTVNLDADELNWLLDRFENGFFVEGFIELISLSNQPDLSIPYMGFYGDWTDAPTMDGSERYDRVIVGGLSYVDYNKVYWPGSYAYSLIDVLEDGEIVTYYDPLGGHISGQFNYNWIAFSPNGDGKFDEMGYRLNLLRNVKKLTVDIIDSKGKLVTGLTDEFDGAYKTKGYVYSNPLNTYALDRWNGTDRFGNKAPDGQYYYVIKTWLDYEGAQAETKMIPVILDTNNPQIVNIAVDEVNEEINFTAYDNSGLLKYVALYNYNGDLNDEDEVDYLAATTPIGGFSDFFDYSEVTTRYATMVAVDMAGNQYRTNVEVNPNIVEPEIYKVTFKLNGGNINGSQNDVVKFVEENTRLNISSITEFDSLTRDGFDFIGWVKYGESEIFDFENIDIDSDSIFVAKWAAKSEYRVTFNLNGGNISGDSNPRYLIVKKGSTVAKPADPVRSGYAFIGWFKDGENTVFNFATEIIADLTLIARWNLIETPGPGPTPGPTPGPAPIPIPEPIPLPEPESVVFNDAANHWAKDDIAFISGLGLVNGTADGQFSPNTNMNRGMIVTILARLAKIDANDYNSSSSFNDVGGNKYYAPFVEWAAQLGIVSGTGNGKFDPEASLTREQLAHILMNYAKLMNLNFKSTSSNNVQFTDANKVSPWAQDSVELAKNLGIIIGSPNGDFDPQRTITRAEVITMLARFIRNIEE